MRYTVAEATWQEIYIHLVGCDKGFLSSLRRKVNIHEYSNKVFRKAVTFEAWSGDIEEEDRGVLVGLVAAYFNDPRGQEGYITSVSVGEAYKERGIASDLMCLCIDYAERHGFRAICLEVERSNDCAVSLYRKLQFHESRDDGASMQMKLELRDTPNYKYIYNFDTDVMHPFMLRSFQPFFVEGNVLDLGCFRGDFTRRLIHRFTDITGVDASSEAIALASEQLGGRVRLINASFESVFLPTRYDNIVLIHTLEHLDDPVLVLQRINDEWLSDKGRLFLVCPNAHAPSRQIAVKMGLISHNTAVTTAEAKHGHRITYTLDVLEWDVKAAGLHIIHKSGIFFKVLANFQWDRLLQTDIISPEYLEGCYQLGQQYPDLCASIFLVCERG